MTQNVLLVGIEYSGPVIPEVKIDVLGLCRPRVDDRRAAFALYEYDVIIINPESYSHFIFGRASKHSASENELWDLKAENNDYDLDTAYDKFDRSAELSAALQQGSRVVWLLTPEKRIHFFGWRSSYMGYASEAVEKIVQSATLHQKKSKRLTINAGAAEFSRYFELLKRDGSRMSMSELPKNCESLAESLEGYSLGIKFAIGKSTGWLLTAPSSQDSANALVQCALGINRADVARQSYHGLFLSHTAADKVFVREIKQRLEVHGVKVWLDEAEILVGDSLTKKIADGLEKTRYIGVVLSPRSIGSHWVGRELEIAIDKEITTGEVVVLPLLYERCELPAFLKGKLYADFTSPANYEEALDKLLRRLKIA